MIMIIIIMMTIIIIVVRKVKPPAAGHGVARSVYKPTTRTPTADQDNQDAGRGHCVGG